MLLGAPLPLAVEPRLADFAFFMRGMLQEALIRVHDSVIQLIIMNGTVDYGWDAGWLAFGVSLRITNSCKMFAALPAAMEIAAFSNVSPTPLSFAG